MSTVAHLPSRPASAQDRSARLRVDRQLFERYARDRDERTRAALVERFLPLARQLARRYAGGGEPLDDLVQVASVGLLKAIDRFDPARGSAFSSFAVPTILGELRRHFRDHGWSVRVPRDLQELTLRIREAGDQLAHARSGPVTALDLARHLGASPEQVIEALQAAGAHRAVSLDAPLDGADGDRDLSMAIPVQEPGYGRAEDAATLRLLTRRLDERDREVLRLRFEADMTQAQIGAQVGLSQMHISRILRQTLGRMADAASPAAPVGR